MTVYVKQSKVGNQVLIAEEGGTGCVAVSAEYVPELISELEELADE